MNTEQSVPKLLVEVLEPVGARRLWLVGRRMATVPPAVPDTQLFAEYLNADSRTRLQDVTAQAGQEIETAGLMRFYRVGLQRAAFELAFPELALDQQQCPWDFLLGGTLRILEPTVFLPDCAAELVSAGTPLALPLLEGWMVGLAGDQVRRLAAGALAEFPIEQLRDNDARPAPFWNEHLAGAFRTRGLEVVFDRARWASAEATRREVERRRLAAVEEQRKEQAVAREAALREQTVLAEFEQRRRQLEHEFEQKRERLEADVQKDRAAREHDLSSAQAERDHQLRLLQESYQQKLAEAQSVTQKARQTLELAAQQHLAELARLQEERAKASEAAVERARQREHEAKARDQEWAAAREKKRLDLLHDQRLTEAAREAELAKFHDASELEREKVVRDLQDSRQARERAEAEHLLALVRLEADREAAMATKLAAARARQHAAEQAELVARAEQEALVRSLEQDRELAEADRKRRLELGQIEFQKRLQEAQSELDQSRRAAELAALDHQQALIDARHRIATVQRQRFEEAQARAREALRQDNEARARYEQQRKDLEHDARLSDARRQQALGLLELEHRRQKLVAEAELACIQRDVEVAQLRHQEAVLELQGRLALKQQLQLEQQRHREARAGCEQERLVRQQEAEIDDLKAKLAHDQSLTTLDREHELEMRRLKHERERELAQNEVDDARRARQLVEAEHQAKLSQAQQDQETLNATRRRVQEAQSQLDATQALLEETRTQLAKADRDREIRSLLVLLNDPSPFEAHQAVEALLRLGFKPRDLAAMGYQVTSHEMLQKFRTKADVDRGAVVLRNRRVLTRSLDRLLAATRGLDDGQAQAQAILGRIVTRDIKSQPKDLRTDINHLELNQSLQFEFTTERAGYVTVVNLGTSGAVVLHVPNFHVDATRARLATPGARSVPGPELLPRELIPDYYEGGPPGDEHIVVVISDEPLAESEWVARSSPHDSLVTLTKSEIAQLSAKLSALPPSSWTAGVLSFYVR